MNKSPIMETSEILSMNGLDDLELAVRQLLQDPEELGRRVAAHMASTPEGSEHLRRVLELIQRFTDDGTFDRMEQAAKLPINGWDRELITTFIDWFEILAKWNRSGLQGNLSAKETMAEQADALAASLDSGTVLTSEPHDLAVALRAFALETRETRDRVSLSRRGNAANAVPANRRGGNRHREEDDVLIDRMAFVFACLGGRPAISSDEPFAHFLEVVWAALPRSLRAASKETFLRRARKLLAEKGA